MPKSKKETQQRKKAVSGPVSSSLVLGVPPKQKALVPYDPLQAYLLEVKKFNLLTREQETELAALVKEKNDEKPPGPDPGRKRRTAPGSQEI